MAKNAVVFACANPIPEIWPWEGKEAGAKIVATGRGDFSNQVNNSLVFPGIFRGALDVRTTTITDEMAVAGAHELAGYAVKQGIQENYLLPTMDRWGSLSKSASGHGVKNSSPRARQSAYTRSTTACRGNTDHSTRT